MGDIKIRKSATGKSSNRKNKKTKSSGPRLPASLRKQLDIIKNPKLDSDDDDNENDNDEEIDSDDVGEIKNDFYEYEEEFAEEESKKNRRYDPVDNFEYQLPEKFKDEDVLSEDDDDVGIDGEDDEDDREQENDSDDGERHARMLQNITGLPTEAFEGRKRKRKEVASEAYPESEFNPSRNSLSSDSKITIHDLLGGTSGLNKNKILRVEKKGISVQPPLPKPDQDRVERQTVYDQTKKDLTNKWERQIKRNRETPSLFFNKRNEVSAPTVGTIASEFKPRSDFEKTIDLLMHDDEVVDAYQNDGIKLLEMNKVSVEDVKDHQDRLAKMRSILFCHEMKAKHIKKIKSKTYHRLKKKDKMKAASLDPETDAEAVRKLAEKQAMERAKARMTFKHKNQGRWARRILERGLDKQDEGTRAAISEQLHQYNRLTRKMNSINDGSSDDSTSNDDDDFDSSDEEGASKLLAKAKEKTLRLIEQEDEVPDSGVVSLPFMVRGMAKRKQAAIEEANRAIDDYDLSLNEEDENAAKRLKHGTSSGRKVFGASQKKVEEPKRRHRPEVDNYGSENEDIIEEDDSGYVGNMELKGDHSHKDLDINLDVLREDLETGQETTFECVNDIAVEDPGSRTNYDVSVFAAGSWKKMKSIKDQSNPTLESNAKLIPEVAEPALYKNAGEELNDDGDSDSDGQMVDGMLSSGAKQTYELPSNEELMRRAFAGDDVEEEFHKAKEDVLNEENPEPEKPLLLPGWGQWSSVQKKRGLPTWISKEHADAKKKREAALKTRKDARLNHVIISEKVDKKADKLYLKTLPYPFTSKEVFEQSNRNPLGPEFNPATVAGHLTRPEVVKKSGIIIPPISFEDVDPHKKEDDERHGKKKRKPNGKNSGKKPINSKRT